MLISLVMCFLSLVGGGMLKSVNVCSCPEKNGILLCRLEEEEGTRLVAGKHGECKMRDLRVTGPGFVSNIEEGLLHRFDSVILERTTLSCEDIVAAETTLVVVNNLVCETTTTTTTINATVIKTTKEPKPRPPAHPDDDDDDDDEEEDYSSTTINTTTSTATTTTATTTTPIRHRITVTTVASFGEWWLICGFVFLVCGSGLVCIIIKIRVQRRAAEQQPVQVPEISSTDNHPQRTYVLKTVPRSPRRRHSESMESVVLYAVDDSEL